jgi:hypothetical protein
MGGKGDNDYEKDTKIIKKIAKVVGIEKGWTFQNKNENNLYYMFQK